MPAQAGECVKTRSASRQTEYQRLKNDIVPGLLFNQTLYERWLFTQVSGNTIWLDAGCGHKILPTWRTSAERQLVGQARFACGCDGDLDAVRRHTNLLNRVVCDLGALPFKSGTFTLVTSNMVMEHVEYPLEAFREFERILKPGGVVMVHTPHRWSYFAMLSAVVPQTIKTRVSQWLDGRPEEDLYPVRYRCNTEKRLRRLFWDVGMTEVQSSMFASEAIFQALAGSALGRFLVRLELYVLRLALWPRWRFLRLSICGMYKKSTDPAPARRHVAYEQRDMMDVKKRTTR